ncbi:MAG: GntR family transcriptional regulator [Cryobacterium sp.]|nr:GntR family transcriptional regulator [Cryobacterium sp.]
MTLTIPGQADDGTPKLDRTPLGSQIASSLRRDILFGRIRPGTRLSQQELCDRFGTSRMPVRDALRELVYSGLLEQDGGRHAIVASLNRADLMDSFTIEGMLGGFAARKAVENATAEDITILEDLHTRMQQSPPEVVAGLNWQFHRHINRMAKSRKLLAALRQVSLDVPRDYLTEFPEWAQRSHTEHEDLLTALRNGDGERAERIMIDHLVESGRGLIDYLEARGLQID